ncbi:ABC transporter ATP-binding protein [Natronosporangium hydrolyticum]|uniref:ABC transporter ATP-binding protein n=1 Tax=Natronosporangium hydrolyticum TaxID=2811111 RepID=A0A895YBJ5_9ACTN|nr:ABC transporter ATP-binding protein [Natronosporangium hydrolyticum]QSB12699.1 ABC transporter ATP-binding protein [Natronosporangium hydrolyticum]
MDGGIEGVGVEVRGLTVRYGSLTAVDGVDLTVAPGEVVGLIGPNGAGKTSLLECVEGLRTAAAGQIRVAGLDPASDRTRLAGLVGVQLQHSAFPSRAKVAEVCSLFASFYPDPADPAELLAQFGLTAAAGQLVSKLSGGQQQRLSLVLALLGRPRLVVLDELTTGLDPAARRSVWEGLRARNDAGLTVLITSHHMDEVEYLCDRVLVLVSGRLVAQGTVSELISTHASDVERLVVEDAADQQELRRELAELGPAVRLTPAGNRLRIEVAEPPLREQVTRLLARYAVTSRSLPASLEDVYLSLTGEQASAKEETSGVR